MAATSENIVDYKKDLPGKIPDDDPKTYVFPVVLSTNRSGKGTEWTIIVRVMDNTGQFQIITDSMYSGQLDKKLSGWIKVISRVSNGKIRDTTPDIITEGKNIGKANETNVFTQALRDAYSKYKKQLRKTDKGQKKGDIIDKADITANLFPPMLAQKLKDQKKPPKWGDECIKENINVQRKYNGVRSPSFLINDIVIMYSRTRKIYSGLTDIKKELKPMFEQFSLDNPGEILYLDGEIYSHGLDLQTISGLTRRILDDKIAADDEKLISTLNYYVYDCFRMKDGKLIGDKFTERNAILTKLFNKFNSNSRVIQVETYQVTSMAEAEQYYTQFLGEKFEGAMVRLDAPYEFSYNDYHSKHLLKMKPREDEEFKIVGYTQGVKGKAKGSLMFVLETNHADPKKKKQFIIKPGGITDEESKKLFSEMSTVEKDGKTVFENKYLGKKLTVLFDEYSKDKVPVRATTDKIIIRNYE